MPTIRKSPVVAVLVGFFAMTILVLPFLILFLSARDTTAPGLAKLVRKSVTPGELRSWASNVVAHPPPETNGVMRFPSPSIWDRIHPPSGTPWIFFITKESNETFPPGIISARSVGGFVNCGITIGPDESFTLPEDQYCVKIWPGIYAQHAP